MFPFLQKVLRFLLRPVYSSKTQRRPSSHPGFKCSRYSHMASNVLDGIYSVCYCLPLSQTFLASIDIRHAYFTHSCLSRSTAFSLLAMGNNQKFVAFPFSLTSAPRVFTKVRVEFLGHRLKDILVVRYPDDLLPQDLLIN